jgi:hypothetical protein
MEAAVIAATVTGGVAIVTAGVALFGSLKTARITSETARFVEKFKTDYDREKTAIEKSKRISAYSEPFARSAYDLQSRLFNILRAPFIDRYLKNGTDREKSYFAKNTTFLLAQFACWTELIRRELQFIDLGESAKTRELVALQDRILGILGSDAPSNSFRVFAGEFRALGEALIQVTPNGPVCMGYGAFLAAYPKGTNVLIDEIQDDVAHLAFRLESYVNRLSSLQHALIDLLAMFDPEYLRFSPESRTKWQGKRVS